MSKTPRQFSLTFEGKVALISGAASGIGYATVERFLRSGVEVLAIDLREPPRLEINGVSSFPISADVRDRAEIERKLAVIGAAPEYVVNCAGVLDSTGFQGVSREAFLRVLDVNLIGAYTLIDVAQAKGKLKSVVNVTSIEASRVVAISDPNPHPAYAASKAALQMLTKTAARGLAEAGVRVNSVAPGFVRTPMALEHGDSMLLPSAVAHRVPLKEFATPEQIADSIAFLLSDQASFITGAELVVDGGFMQS